MLKSKAEDTGGTINLIREFTGWRQQRELGYVAGHFLRWTFAIVVIATTRSRKPLDDEHHQDAMVSLANLGNVSRGKGSGIQLMRSVVNTGISSDTSKTLVVSSRSECI